MTEAIDRDLIEQLDPLLTQTREVGLGSQGARTIGLAMLLEANDQVHIGREIQFTATEFAQAKDDRIDAMALRIAHHTVTQLKISLYRSQSGLHADIGQVGDALHRFGQGIHAQDIAPDDPCRLLLAILPQQAGPCLAVVRR